ncbi:hypothetical protein BIT28_17160 [Photobacterium proteolyticum]|uniref:MSHA biogenesis protein MshP n=1 Tax=Photobacterium proteolyticum TaxID=1903952 RepID=A0A1Q9GYN7_9GAMM|nr:hypothetical protein [Photobacterium proteolyticum]OLQ80457.1 hypothetical protein BIT28_17160 [Photobacterium proteolyticum]
MSYSKQRGSALIVSVFIITVMAGFAAAMIRIDWSGQEMTSREVFATRAWFAAHSGNEYVLSKLFPLGQKASDPDACSQGGSSDSKTYSVDASLFQCQKVTVVCTRFKYGSDSQSAYKYQLESSATCGNGKFATTRTQETWAKDLP